MSTSYSEVKSEVGKKSSEMHLYSGLHTSAGVLVHSDESWQAVAEMAAWQVDTHCVGLAVMHLGCTLINI